MKPKYTKRLYRRKNNENFDKEVNRKTYNSKNRACKKHSKIGNIILKYTYFPNQNNLLPKYP